MRDDTIFALGVTLITLTGALAMAGGDQPSAPTAIERPALIQPAVGSLWEIKTGDPFPINSPAIKVLETKAGWVRYYVCSTMPDERCTIEVFLTIHRAAIKNEGKVTP